MDNIKRLAKKLLQHKGDMPLATLDATLELQDSIEEVKKAIQNIPETVIPEMPEHPTEMEVTMKGISVVTLKGEKGDSPTEEELVSLIKPLIPEPIPGKKGDKGDTMIVEKIVEKIEVVKEQPIITNEIVEVAKYEEPKNIADKLNTLEEVIDQKVIKGLTKKISDISNNVANQAIGAMPVTTTFVNGKRAKNINFPSATVTQQGDTVSVVTQSSAASLDVGTTAIANGASGTVLTDTGGTLGELAYSTTATASNIVERDANANIFANNYISNTTSTVSAGGTTVLTAASSRLQILTGSSNQNYQLPDATTLAISAWFTFNNNSSGSLVIKNAGSTTLYTVPAGGAVDCFVTNISSANGVWDFHALTPSITTWSSGTSGLIFNTALTTSPQITTGASSATVPSFIPQRGASTTGFGGDGTNLHAIIAGATSTTFNSTGLSVGTSGVVATGTVEIGHASDTTLARVSAGVASIEGATIATLPATQTFTGQNKFNNFIDVNNAITASSNAATVPVTYRLNTVTNNSAATLTITMTTTSAVDGQMTVVRILDASAVAQTITWVNTENSTVTAPTTSNGSTTLPLTVGFQYNSATSKWRCIAKC